MGETILRTQFKQALTDHSEDMFQVFGRLDPGSSATAANSAMARFRLPSTSSTAKETMPRA
jgi:hypothetical protein